MLKKTLQMKDLVSKEHCYYKIHALMENGAPPFYRHHSPLYGLSFYFSLIPSYDFSKISTPRSPTPPTLARNCRKFWYIYRHLCSNKRILKLTYWDVMPEKLMVENFYK